MIELRPCGECQRHVAVTESACPFCAAVLAAPAPRDLPLGRLSRAAVFAAGALAASACGGKAKPADHVQNVPTADAGVTPDAPKPPERIETGPMGGDHTPARPYGAPPARRRLV
ncbi:MAG: hypothetical protein JWO36_3946 [Myxococcales bacterium]|nr:hypothetical protein [Myxococcales bacterium]